MASISYHAVVAFGVSANGALAPVAEHAAGSLEEAILHARRLGKAYAGAIAFSRTMDVGRGRYGIANVHAVEGCIPSDFAPMCGQWPGSRRLSDEDSSRTIPRPQSGVSPVSVVVRRARWRG